MKKSHKIAIAILIAAVVASLIFGGVSIGQSIAAEKAATAPDSQNPARFVIVNNLDDGCAPIISGHGRVIYLVDTTTKVVYCEIMTSRQVFPVLQSDGTPLLYEGEL